jgi:predicted RecB family nuclease
LAALPQEGSIVVYNQQFEAARLDELAAALPEFAERIKNIQSRLWDLLPIVRNHVYHPAFAGSYSLKSVLPALVPEMSYEGLEVANGQDAGLAWQVMLRTSDKTERERLRKALLDYCRLDTFALVKIVQKLRG